MGPLNGDVSVRTAPPWVGARVAQSPESSLMNSVADVPLPAVRSTVKAPPGLQTVWYAPGAAIQ